MTDHDNPGLAAPTLDELSAIEGGGGICFEPFDPYPWKPSFPLPSCGPEPEQK